MFACSSLIITSVCVSARAYNNYNWETLRDCGSLPQGGPSQAVYTVKINSSTAPASLPKMRSTAEQKV